MTTSTSPRPQPQRARPAFGQRILGQYGLAVVLLAVLLLFSLLRPDTFLTESNLRMIASTNAVLALLALAAIAPLVCGQFDLSIGFTLSISQALVIGLVVHQGLDPAIAMLLALATGLLIGVLNGLLVAYGGLNAFITTLATGILVQGITQWYTKGESLFGQVPAWFLALGRQDIGPLPAPLVYVLAIAALLWLAYEHTAWGRRNLAIGGNAQAARFCGIDVPRLTLGSFALAGFLAALAGVLSASILGSANPNIGANYLLSAFAAVFLGATCIRPGRFNAPGTLLAVYTLAVGIAGLQQLGADFYVEQLFNGAALLLALGLSHWSARRRTTAAA